MLNLSLLIWYVAASKSNYYIVVSDWLAFFFRIVLVRFREPMSQVAQPKEYQVLVSK